MSYNGSGTFQINSAGQPVVAGTVITAAAFNALTADLATGLSTAMTKDGQTTATANIPMGNNKFTGLAAGTAGTDSVNLKQVQGNVASLISVSGIDTITGSMSPTLTAYSTGAMYWFVASGTNTGAVTINIDALGAKAVTRDGSTALIAGDIVSGQVAVIVYDGTRFQLQKANAFGTLTATTINTTNLTATGTVNLTGATVSNGGSVTTIDINGGTIDGAVIGGASAAAGTFTTATVGAGLVGTPSLTTTGDTNTGLFFPAADTIAATTGGSERMRIDSAGRVGIGTTSPSTNGALSVYGTVVLGPLTRNQAATNSIGVWTSGDPLDDSRASIRFTTTAGAASSDSYITFATNNYGVSGGERMRIDSSGNVGIGTTSPSSFGKFAVQGASTNRVFYADSLAQPVARYDDNSFISNGLTIRNSGVSGSNQGIGLLFQLGTGGTAVDGGAIQMRSEADFSSAANRDAAMTFSTVLDGTMAERMRITASGNVVAGGSAALATTATDGFLYVPTCAGTPTGTPTAITGMAPIVVNTTNNKLYFYSGGAWRDAGP